MAARQAGGYLGRLLLGELDDFAVREIPVGKVELVDNVVFAAADQQLFSVGGEAEAVERLWQGDTRHDAGRLEIDDDDFMRSIARMQNRGPIALRVQGHIDGKVPDFDLLARRPQRPLVRQQHGPVGLQSRQRAEQQSRVGRGLLGKNGTCRQYEGRVAAISRKVEYAHRLASRKKEESEVVWRSL